MAAVNDEADTHSYVSVSFDSIKKKKTALFNFQESVQFSSVQSLSHVQLFATP